MSEMEEIIALHRYYICANRFRTLFDSLFPLPQDWQENRTPQHSLHGDLGIFMNHWYAGLYTVVEGWRELKLSDPKIDKLIHSDNVHLLRKFRNTVYHYQRDYYDKRYLEFLQGAMEKVPWIWELNRELGLYFLKRFRLEDPSSEGET